MLFQGSLAASSPSIAGFDLHAAGKASRPHLVSTHATRAKPYYSGLLHIILAHLALSAHRCLASKERRASRGTLFAFRVGRSWTGYRSVVPLKAKAPAQVRCCAQVSSGKQHQPAKHRTPGFLMKLPEPSAITVYPQRQPTEKVVD